MNYEANYEQFVVFDLDIFTEEQSKVDGNQAKSVLGIIRARDEFHAQDTASARFPDRSVFVRARDKADPVYVDAAEKMGYLNTSEAHRP